MKKMDGYLSGVEFSKMMRVDRTTLNNWEKKGKLEPHKIVTDGGRIYKFYGQEHIDIIKSWGTKESLMLELMGL